MQKRWQNFRSYLAQVGWVKWLKWGSIAGVVGLLTGILFVGYLFMAVRAGLYGPLPSHEELGNVVQAEASEIYFSDEKTLMGKYYWQNRTNVALADISPELIEALVATEDARFYEHHGIDLRSTMRVVFKSILLGDRSAGGGSTISQQLAKNLYPRESHGLLSLPVNKFKEMLIAQRLEEVYSKDQILELYLNTVPFGENVFGVGAASERFFSQNPSDIPIEQAAVLVGMLKANTSYNPQRYPQQAIERRNVVLDQMSRYEYLTAELADSLKHTKLGTQYKKLSISEGPAPYFRQQMAGEIKKWLEANPGPDGKVYNLYTDGLRIYTTIDERMQHLAESAVRDQMKALQAEFDKHWEGRELWKMSDSGIQRAMKQSKRYRSLKNRGVSEKKIQEVFDQAIPMTIWTWDGEKEVEMSPQDSVVHYQSFLQAGFLAMEPQTGYVRAWVGGINFEHYKYDHITSRRQVGSTFKPIIYAAAIDQGMDPCEYIANEQRVYPEFKNWSPGNSDGKYEGFYSLKGGLANSVNTVSAEVMKRVGVEPAVQFAEKFGFTGLPHEASLVLGTADLSLLEMVGGYSAFANEGMRAVPVYLVRIKDAHGNVLMEFSPESEPIQVMESTTASMMTDMLQTVVRSGTASRLRRTYGLTNEIGGKTGTTQNQTDGWFMGVTPHLVAGAWVGGEDRQLRFRTLRLGQGANTALPIYGRFMQGLYQESEYSDWKNDRFPPIPASVLNAMDCSMYEERDPNFLPNNLPQLWQNIREQWDERREERQEKREERRRNPWSEPEPKRNQPRLPWQRKKSDRSKRMFDDS